MSKRRPLCFTERETFWDLRVLTTRTLRFCLPSISIKFTEIIVFYFLFPRMFYHKYLTKGKGIGVTGFPGTPFSATLQCLTIRAKLIYVSFSSLELFSGTHLFSLSAPLHVLFSLSSILHLGLKRREQN